MHLVRIAVRCLAVYVFLLALLRFAGKRTIQQSTPFDFVLALIIGDLADDAIWAGAPIAQFVVSAETLLLTKFMLTLHKLRRSV